ncbi:MAG TPA: hypothetical protein VG838_12545 [Opitutaceae bacterium]|nr:hypothetical protein [Opitutaceae bacterium]HWA10274.1 hypothetical protein [Opitutaceae bacterium]
MKLALGLIPWALFAATPAAPTATGTLGAVNQSTLPVFTKEGYRSLLVRASEMRFISQDRVDTTGLNLSVFTGDATERIETILLSPEATFLRNENVARGEKSVRFIRDDFEASGTRWVYNHGEKRISLDGNVRVVFHAELKDILK